MLILKIVLLLSSLLLLCVRYWSFSKLHFSPRGQGHPPPFYFDVVSVGGAIFCVCFATSSSFYSYQTGNI